MAGPPFLPAFHDGEAFHSEALHHAVAQRGIAFTRSLFPRDRCRILDHPARAFGTMPEEVAFSASPFDRRTICAMQRSFHEPERRSWDAHDLARSNPIVEEACRKHFQQCRKRLDRRHRGVLWNRRSDERARLPACHAAEKALGAPENNGNAGSAADSIPGA